MENRFTEISQIGFVICDKERILKGMREVFGVEPDKVVMTKADDGRVYRGEPGDFVAELIFYKFANIELEFIRPISGKSIWQEHLDAHGEGLHHIQFAVDSFEGARNQMHGADVEMLQEGLSARPVPGLRFGYFDTFAKLAFILEIFNEKELKTDTSCQ